MACFLVPAAEAVAVTVAARVLQKREADAQHTPRIDGKLPLSRKLGWLSNLLWGGSALLAYEHLWHGEIVPWFPFLTAASDPAALAEMLGEMSTVGVTMAAIVTAVWAGVAAVADSIARRAASERRVAP